jgi:hypothetical protein
MFLECAELARCVMSEDATPVSAVNATPEMILWLSQLYRLIDFNVDSATPARDASTDRFESLPRQLYAQT